MMEHYTGNCYYQPLREGRRTLYKKDGSFSPPVMQADPLSLVGSIAKYHRETTGDIQILELLPGSFGNASHCRVYVTAIDTLSYMWVDLPPKERIILDGEIFPVTGSLDPFVTDNKELT
jgi:hypothetical protein